MSKPVVGSKFFHHGHVHEVTSLPERARMVKGKAKVIHGLVFENDTYEGTCLLEDVQYNEALGVYYLPGRVLSRNERALVASVTGAWPPAVQHWALAAMLDSVPMEDIDRVRLAEVLVERKPDLQAQLSGTEKVDAPVISAYVDAVIEQCSVSRANRGGLK